MRENGKIKISFIAGTLGRGGAERQLVYMLRALLAAGVSARVLCLTNGEPFEREINALGVPITWVGKFRSRAMRLSRIVQTLRNDRPDILQSTHFYTNLYAAAAARILRRRDIGAIRCDLVTELRDNGVLGWPQLLMPRHLIANSERARENAIKRGISPGRIDFVRNAVEVKEHGRQVQTNGRHVQVLFVGRLTQQKRPDRFVRILSRIINEAPEYRITAKIIGDGPLKGQTQALTRDLGLPPDRVELLGAHDDLSPFYRQSNMLMLTSDWEGTPNVLLEAMAHGLPVVATKVGGVTEIVGPDRGFVVDPGDEDGLTAAALKLITNPELRLEVGMRASAYAKRLHSLDAVQTQLLSIYEKILVH